MKSTFTMLASASLALGHATFQQLWIDGVDQDSVCARLPPSNSPIEDVTSNDLRCNRNGATGVSGVCTIAAGSSVEVEMHEQPGDRACDQPAIGGNHYGPVIVYMAAVDDATTADGSDPFFKVAEYGYSSEDGLWGTDVLNEQCGRFEFTVPADLAPGDYLIRAEAVALHAATSPGGAQFYMTCYQVTVTGSGSTEGPADAVFPGEYEADHPGILINIWMDDIDNYVIPGPDVASL